MSDSEVWVVSKPRGVKNNHVQETSGGGDSIARNPWIDAETMQLEMQSLATGLQGCLDTDQRIRFWNDLYSFLLTEEEREDWPPDYSVERPDGLASSIVVCTIELRKRVPLCERRVFWQKLYKALFAPEERHS